MAPRRLWSGVEVHGGMKSSVGRRRAVTSRLSGHRWPWVVLTGLAWVGSAAGQAPKPLDVIYVPTPDAVVRRMLETARVATGDIVYDLGSGDGRIVVAAVRDFNAARGVGIELDPQRVAEARANAAAAGVSDRVEFLQADLFEADLSPATVVTMYLLPAINARLQPKLRALRPGTRIVSHNYDMGAAWKPARTIYLERDVIHAWTVPRR